METVAVLGTGLLGSGFVRAFRRRGVAVRAWNRSPDKARALESVGAVVAADPADAVRGVDRVHLVLSDDAAVDDVLARAGDVRVPVIDHSTVSPAGVARRARARADADRVYLHAPVFMGPVNAAESTGIMLVSGPSAVVDGLVPDLAPMTGKIVRLGERPDAAAAYKLFGNSALITLVAAASDVLTLARSLGIDEQEALGLFGQFDPGPTLRLRGGRIAKREFAPASFELAMARKDLRLMLEAAGGAPLIALPAIAARVDELLAEGHGQQDLSVLGIPRGQGVPDRRDEP